MPYSYGNFIASPNQDKTINHPPAPLMILAGAGTGKTTTLLHRIRHLIISKSVQAKNVVLLTFTEKATDEARHTIQDILGSKSEGVFVGTFHSFCHSLMRKYGPEERIDDILWEESDIIFFLKNHFDDMDFIQSRLFSADPISAIRNSFIPFFNRIRDELLTPKEIDSKIKKIVSSPEWIINEFPGIHPKNTDFDDAILQLNDLIKAYNFFQQAKFNNNALDYGDMILGSHKLLSSNKKVLSEVRNNYKHIFIDEYQDNNYALNIIVNLINNHNPSITVVGDEDQCIYSFRGANYNNINDFRKRYSNHAQYSEIQLIENRRSTQEILDLANTSIEKNLERTPKSLKCVPTDIKNGPKPVWYQTNKEETLEIIPNLIHEIINSERALYGDISIVCRGWSNVQDIALSLQKSAIPVDIHIEKFFDVPIVKDVLAWGNLISQSDSDSENALFRILRERMGVKWASDFFNSNSNLTIDKKMELLRVKSDKSHSLNPIINGYDQLKNILKQNRKIDEIVWSILEVLKKFKLVSDMRNSYRYRERLNLSNVGELFNLAEKFANTNPDKTLNEWLEFMKVMAFSSGKIASQPELGSENLAIQIMTIHRSKGLQFPIVIIPFLQSGTFPSNLKKHSLIDRLPNSWQKWKTDSKTTFRQYHESEERRIFYVGITRAEKEIYLFGPTLRQSLFTKELDLDISKLMEVRSMDNELKKGQSLSDRKQKLLAELNKEIAAGQINNAREILDEMENPSIKETNNGDIKTDISGILNLSATKIESYDRCPYKYRLKYIDHVPERKTRATGEFGSIIHNILEEFHKLSQEEQSKDILLELLDKYWKEESFEYRLRGEEFKKQGKEILNDYWNFIATNPPSVIECEKTFSYLMNDINVNISGKIDRIDKDGERFGIVDYKTSKNKVKADQNLQMALYTEAILRNAVKGIKGKPGKASLHFLRHGDDPISSHQFNDAELSKFREKIKSVSEGIRKGSFETKKAEFTCRYCDYKDFLCPAWEE